MARTSIESRLDRLVRDEGRIVLATLVRMTGDLQLAEDAMQDATVQAMRVWRARGIPDNPRAWLILTARNRAIDIIRRERQRFTREKGAMDLLDSLGGDPADFADESAVRDDQLRLIFLCCHPALDRPAQVALSLRVLCGLSVAEVADALLVPQATMAKRLTRAKAKIRDARIPYRVPNDDELPTRLDAVAAVLFLLFNEGYASRRSGGGARVELAEEAVRMARVLVELMPADASAEGLLATLLLQHSRRTSRFDEGEVVLLGDQDRSRWDAAMTAEGVQRAADAVRLSSVTPNRFAVTAAIAASHVIDPERVDWAGIVAWYDVLVTLDASPVVRLNRAVAIAERDGAAAGLDVMDAVAGLESYPWFHAARGELLFREGRHGEAVAAFERALAEFAGADGPVRHHLERRRAEAAALLPPPASLGDAPDA